MTYRYEAEFTCPKCGGHHWGSYDITTACATYRCTDCGWSDMYSRRYEHTTFHIRTHSPAMFRALEALGVAHLELMEKARHA